MKMQAFVRIGIGLALGLGVAACGSSTGNLTAPTPLPGTGNSGASSQDGSGLVGSWQLVSLTEAGKPSVERVVARAVHRHVRQRRAGLASGRLQSLRRQLQGAGERPDRRTDGLHPGLLPERAARHEVRGSREPGDDVVLDPGRRSSCDATRVCSSFRRNSTTRPPTRPGPWARSAPVFRPAARA